jgi:hypothetical protein
MTTWAWRKGTGKGGSSNEPPSNQRTDASLGDNIMSQCHYETSIKITTKLAISLRTGSEPTETRELPREKKKQRPSQCQIFLTSRVSLITVDLLRSSRSGQSFFFSPFRHPSTHCTHTHTTRHAKKKRAHVSLHVDTTPPSACVSILMSNPAHLQSSA